MPGDKAVPGVLGGDMPSGPAKRFGPQSASEVRKTMESWERVLSGDPLTASPADNVVVASWLRSRAMGINPTASAAPLAAVGDSLHAMQEAHRDLMFAATDIFTRAAAHLDGSGSIMLLTNPDGIVLDVVGDRSTLESAQDIHLMHGGLWGERAVGTNGIGMALATRSPAQVHASEHFCEGIKNWTCAAAPVFDPLSHDLMGAIDISGLPSTYQHNNLTLAVFVARQVETALSERSAHVKARLLEIALERFNAFDLSGGLIAVDRMGRLVHVTGRLPRHLDVGQRIPGFSADLPVEDWANGLPDWLAGGHFVPVKKDDESIGALLLVGSRRKGTNQQRNAMRSPLAGTGQGGFSRIIGESDIMRSTIARAQTLARRHVPVLVDGETGTGKELFAKAIHATFSPDAPFIALNCGGIPHDLLAAELFGHVRGAFTGASNEGRLGRFEMANGGILCLDEIGEMPLDLQPYLLRVLEEGLVYRLGDSQARRVDVRLLALTNRDLAVEVEKGTFRRDLFHRIAVTRVHVPPLRERIGDLPLLLDCFIHQIADLHGIPPARATDAALLALQAYHWPGNVRELRNLIESLMLTTDLEVFDAADVQAAIGTAAPPQVSELHRSSTPDQDSLSLESAERRAIESAVRSCHGNLSDAARLLGVSRSTLYRKMEGFRHRGSDIA